MDVSASYTFQNAERTIQRSIKLNLPNNPKKKSAFESCAVAVHSVDSENSSQASSSPSAVQHTPSAVQQTTSAVQKTPSIANTPSTSHSLSSTPSGYQQTPLIAKRRIPAKTRGSKRQKTIVDDEEMDKSKKKSVSKRKEVEKCRKKTAPKTETAIRCADCSGKVIKYLYSCYHMFCEQCIVHARENLIRAATQRSRNPKMLERRIHTINTVDIPCPIERCSGTKQFNVTM